MPIEDAVIGMIVGAAVCAVLGAVIYVLEKKRKLILKK